MSARLSRLIPCVGLLAASALAFNVSSAAAAGGQPSDEPPKCAAPGEKAQVVPPGARIYGRSYAEWTADWWQWAFSTPMEINPVWDVNGDYCATAQHGPVWFLAGTFTGGVSARHCSIPCDRAIFFPVKNAEWENGWAGEPDRSIAELRELCEGAGDPTGAIVEIDGVQVNNLAQYRVQSDLFPYSFAPGNFPGQAPGVYFPVVSDGIWIMLRPLSPGTHVLHFTTGDGWQDMTYTLDVVALEAP